MRPGPTLSHETLVGGMNMRGINSAFRQSVEFGTKESVKESVKEGVKESVKESVRMARDRVMHGMVGDRPFLFV
ncbi:hypothetical protein Pmani_021372 [Petrolisthes manimaculis]|uniref:Uncharacterized protein n=1 Tax=Petrolisthes manimaculis TaxID=1843537 RepID=A0AAE1PEA7_9EUCA|nr:hypothetical protein Pmani_021372 [Petrolisthes manimaculis]